MWFKKQNQELIQKCEELWKFIKEIDEFKEKMREYIPTISEDQIKTELEQSSTAKDKGRLFKIVAQEEESMLEEYDFFLEKIDYTSIVDIYDCYNFSTYMYKKSELNEVISNISNYYFELKNYIWNYENITKKERLKKEITKIYEENIDKLCEIIIPSEE